MNQSIDLKRILLLWKKEYGDPGKSRRGADYIQIDIGKRFELLKILVRYIKSMGKPEEYFTGSTRSLIAESCVPPEGAIDNQKFKKFKTAAMSHLDMAIIEVYSESNIFKNEEGPKRGLSTFKEFDPSKIKNDEDEIDEILDPEMAALLGFDNE